MGKRGSSIHVRVRNRWTLVPPAGETADVAALSKELGKTLAQVWFDDDVGVALQVYEGGALLGELSLPNDDEAKSLTDADRAFVEKHRLDALLPRAAKPKKKTAAKALGPEKTSWTDEERATLDLHAEYWRTVFSMNNWKLYNRYKKHLPAEQRRDVDALCSAVATGDDAVIDSKVTSILARIWDAEDWDAVIRDPALEDNDADVWHAWRARTAR